jgi:signal transduction histidine kinase
MTRSLVALWCMLLAAILTISVLAQFWISQRQRSAQQRVEELLLAQLVPHNDSIGRLVESYSLEMQQNAAACDLHDASSCLAVLRSPWIDSLTVVDADSRLVYPSNISAASQDRQSLIAEAQQLLQEMADPRPSARQKLAPQANIKGEPAEASYEDLQIFNSRSYGNRWQAESQAGKLGETTSPRVRQSQPASAPEILADTDSATPRESNSGESTGESTGLAKGKEFGWITWYHRRGMVLGFWWNQGEQRRAIATIPRSRWMADIVAALPDTSQTLAPSFGSKLGEMQQEALNQLIDVEGNVIYQWGSLPSELSTPAEDHVPDAILSVAPPLEGWRLRIYASPSLRQLLAGDNIVLPLWLAVGGLSLALVLGGVMVTTSFNRQMRQAARRVSFVNQVSHELRTPLTNICMYADLLANSMAADESENSANVQRVTVIQNESQRLSRLIGNVLQFARSDSQPSELHLREAVIDEVIRDVLRIFGPRLQEVGIDLSMNLSAGQRRRFDPDVVEQILVNLIGNAEKYAAAGKRLEVTSCGNGAQVEITVRDYGPGVPARMADRIFQPFVRVSDRLEDPAGTGIGLTIVRDLARRHGGDCVLQPGHPGAAFCCTLQASLTSAASK